MGHRLLCNKHYSITSKHTHVLTNHLLVGLWSLLQYSIAIAYLASRKLKLSLASKQASCIYCTRDNPHSWTISI